MFDEQPVLAASVEDLNRNRLEAFVTGGSAGSRFGRNPDRTYADFCGVATLVALRNPGAVSGILRGP